MNTFFQPKIIIVLELLFEWSRRVANDTFYNYQSFSLPHGFNTYIFRFKISFMRFTLFTSSFEFDTSQIALCKLNLGEIQDNNECGKAPGKQLD